MWEKLSISGWARKLGGGDGKGGDPMTLQEAQVFAAIAQCDRSVEILVALQDIQARVHRMELFIESHFPDYNERSRRQLLALQNGSVHGPQH